MKLITRGEIKITKPLTVYQTASSMYCWVWWHKPSSGKNAPSCYYEVRYADTAWRRIAVMTGHNLGALRSILTTTYGGVVVEIKQVGTAAAAAILGLSADTTKGQVLKGKLAATKPGRDHLIEVAEVARYGIENRRTQLTSEE